MMYERFTRRARKVIQLATQAAKKSHQEQMDIEDMLLAVLQNEDGGAATVIDAFGVARQTLRSATEEIIRPVANHKRLKMQPPTLRAKRAIEYAITERLDLSGVGNVGTEHLLLGIACEGESKAAQVLTRFGMTPQSVRAKIRLLAALPD